MADINDFGDVKEGFEHISELLDSIRAQNAMKAGDWDKAFLNISSKLEDLSDQENTDLIKVFLAEIKRTLDERHNFVSSKFSDIESSFRTLEQKSSGGLNADEMREIFDIIATNLNVFSKEVVSQKDLLSEITLRIEELKNDDSQKRDILRNISVLKVELERFNNGFESIILNLNENFKSVSNAMAALDNKEELQGFKKDIENIFLSSNAVLSALQVIDRKNRELEDVLVNVVTKDEFNLEREQVARLIAQNLQLSEYISNLADKRGVEDLNSKIDTAVGVINALKSVLQESSMQNQQMLGAQLEKLEATVSTIISEEDFLKFRTELFRLVEEGIQSSNMVRAEMLDTNAELRNLFNFLNSFEIKSNFQELSGTLKSTEDNVKATIWELSSKIAQENEKTKTLITTDINGNLRTVVQKIDMFEEGVKETAKSNLTTVLENIQSVINNLFTIKSEVHVDNQETLETVSDRIIGLKTDIAASKESVLKGSQSNFEKLSQSVEKVSQKLDSNEQTITQAVGSSLSGINSEFENLGQKIDEAKFELNQNSQSSVESLSSGIDSLSSKISEAQGGLEREIKTSSDSVLSGIDGLSSQVESVKNSVEGKLDSSLSGFENKFENLSTHIDSVKGALGGKIDSSLGNLVSNIESLNFKLDVNQSSIADNIQSNLEGLVSTYDGLSEQIESVKHLIAPEVQAGVSGLFSDVAEIGRKIEGTKHSLAQSAKENLDSILSQIADLSNELTEAKEGLTNNSEANFSNILMLVDKFSSEISQLKDTLNQSSQQSWAEIKASLDSSAKGLEAVKSDFASISRESMIGLKSDIQSLFEIFDSAKELTEGKIHSGFEKVSSSFVSLSKELELIKEIMNQSVKTSFEDISRKFIEFSDHFVEVQKDSKSEITLVINSLQEKMEALPDALRQVQESYGEAHAVLIEQNSKNIEELGEKIQNLVKSIIHKDNPFKESLTLELSQLRDNLDGLKDEFSNTSRFNLEDIKKSVSSVESLIGENKELLEANLYNLHTNLKEYLDSIKRNSDFNVEKIGYTAENVLELKSELSELQQEVEKLVSDSRFAELAGEVNNKVDGLLLNITQSGEISSSKIQDRLQKGLSVLDEQFAKISEALTQNSQESKKDFTEGLVGLEQKINLIKEHMSLMNSDFEGVLNARTSEIVESFEPLKSSIDEIKEINIEAVFEEVKDKIDSVSQSLKNLIEDNSSSISEDLSGRLNKITDSVSVLEQRIQQTQDELSKDRYSQDFSELKGLLSSVSETLISFDNSQKIDDLQNLVKAIGAKIDSFELDLTPVETSIKSTLEKTNQLIRENQLETLDSQDEIKSSLLKGFDDNMMLVKSNLDELISVKSELIDEISSAKEFLQQEASNRAVEMKSELLSEMTELVSQITRAQDSLADYKMDISDLLKVQDDGLREQIKLVEDAVINEISSNIDDFKSLVEQSIKQTETKLELSEQNYKTTVQSLLSDVKISFYEKVEDGIDDIRSFLEVFETKLEFASELSELKEEIFEKLEGVSQEVELSVANVDVKEDLQELSQSLELSVQGLLDNLHDRIVIAMDDNKLTQDVLQKSEEIERRIEDLKRVVSDDVSQRVEAFGVSIEKQSEDFSNLISELKVSMTELKENYVDLSLNSSMEISNLLSTIQDKIEGIEEKLEGYSFESLIESTKKELLEEISTVKNSLIDAVRENEPKFDFESAFSEKFDVINSKLDILSLAENSDLEAEISEIKEKIEAQSTLLDGLKSLEKLEEVSKVSQGQDEIKSVITSLEEKLEKLASAEPETQQEVFDIKQDLDVVKKEIIENLLSIFDQISFVVEAEEIKDFVEEKAQETNDLIELGLRSTQDEIKEVIERNAQEIKSEIQKLTGLNLAPSADESSIEEFLEEDNIKSSLGNNFDDIISSLDSLNEKAQGSEGYLFDIKDEIETVKKHLLTIQNGSDEESAGYSYSLQDVESDIAKVRLILDEIAKKKEDVSLDKLNNLERLNSLDRLEDLDKLNNLDKMNEDIISISTRTNKLLLTSDESYNTLKENLNEFRGIVYNLEQKVRQIDNTESNKRLDSKLDNINNLVLSGVKSDKTFNQAFMYLAQWVDEADSKFANIAKGVSELSEVKDSIESIKESIPDNNEVLSTLDSIADKFDKQQKRIDKLENKIDQLLEKLSVQPQEDLKSLIEKALSQTGSTAGAKVDAKLAKKVDGIDRQLTKLSKGVEKLTSYVE